MSRFVVVLQSKLNKFGDQGFKYYTKTASGTQKITKLHFCLYLVDIHTCWSTTDTATYRLNRPRGNGRALSSLNKPFFNNKKSAFIQKKKTTVKVDVTKGKAKRVCNHFQLPQHFFISVTTTPSMSTRE